MGPAKAGGQILVIHEIATPLGLAMTMSFLLLVYAMRYAAYFESPGGPFVKVQVFGIHDSFQG
jgi:hypothetical protein